MYEAKLVLTPNGEFVYTDETNPLENWLANGARLATDEEIAAEEARKHPDATPVSDDSSVTPPQENGEVVATPNVVNPIDTIDY